MVRGFRFALILIVLALLQCCVIHRIGRMGVRPDLLFILAFFIGLTANRPAVAPACIFVGLARDLLSIERFGVGMLIYLAAGMAIFLLRRRYASEFPLVQAILAFVILCCLNWLYGFALRAVHPQMSLGAWLGASAGQALLTALLTPLGCAVLRRSRIIRPYREF
jgi:rod shape-determining protein MreD